MQPKMEQPVKSVQQQQQPSGQNQPKPRPLPRGSSIEKPPSPKNRQTSLANTSVNKPQTTQQVSQPRKQLPPLPQQQQPTSR